MTSNTSRRNAENFARNVACISLTWLVYAWQSDFVCTARFLSSHGPSLFFGSRLETILVSIICSEQQLLLYDPNIVSIYLTYGRFQYYSSFVRFFNEIVVIDSYLIRANI